MSSFMRLRRLTRQDLAMACRAACTLTLFCVLVRTRDVRSLESRIRAGGRHGSPDPGVAPSRLVGIVRRVARIHPLRPQCLEQALTAALLAERAGFSTSVHIGVRRVPNLGTRELEGHAWVVISGVTMDRAAADFTTIASLHGSLPAGNHLQDSMQTAVHV